jgi:MFS family permease
MDKVSVLVLQAEKVNNDVACKELESPKPSQTSVQKKTATFYVIIYTLALLGFMGAVDSVSTSSALPSIIKSLSDDGSSPTTTAAYWTGTGFYLAQTVVIPVFANASDIVGRKPCITLAVLLFLVGAILCGWAQNIAWLIAARVVGRLSVVDSDTDTRTQIQGFGSAGILALGPVIVTDLTNLRERAKYTTIMVLSWAVGMNGGVR